MTIKDMTYDVTLTTLQSRHLFTMFLSIPERYAIQLCGLHSVAEQEYTSKLSEGCFLPLFSEVAEFVS